MRRFVYLCVPLLAALVETGARAQCSSYDRAPFENATRLADQHLTALEDIAQRVLKSRRLTAADGSETTQLIDSYGLQMFAAYQMAHEAAQQASETQGQEGSGAVLGEFELLAQRHQVRTYQWALKWDEIHAGITQGQIVEAGLLPQDKRTPLQELSGEGGQMLGQNIDSAIRPEFARMAQLGVEQQQSFGSQCEQAAGAVMSFFVPTAEASQIFPCIGPCFSGNWSACLTCIQNAAAVVIQAWNEFRNCWSSAGTCAWWNPWACIRRAWCLVRFIAVLA